MVDDVDLVEQNDEELILPPVEPQLRISTRERKVPARYSSNEYVILADACKLETYQETMSVDQEKELLKVIQDEIQSFH